MDDTKKTTKALQVWVGREKEDVALTVEDQVNALSLRTPEQYIMQRKGRGGMTFDYVETNYVLGRLNATFMFDWDIEILDKIIDKENDQIAINVRLTVRFADGKVVKKDAWGGSEIKRLKENKKIMDIADDLKAAESDATKKAASMLGICWDVYSGQTKNGKGKKSEKKDSKDFGDMGGEPDKNAEFRTISLTIKDKIFLLTKFEALAHYQKAKKAMGNESYYKVLGEAGYEKSNQIPDNKLPEIYYKLVDTFKTGESQ